MKSVLLGHRQYCQVLGKTYRGLPAPAIAAAAQVYRKLGFKYIFASQGLSIYCYLSQPRA